MKKSLILVCNSHIDPVWLWEWEEGVAETLSTFRTAIRFCDKYKDFIFCHNESLLYEWVEKFDPKLFERIREYISEGRWHIMGGWYLQPDCNMLLAESVVRQIVTGKKYFIEKFGKEPHTAINFDSFGHSRGLVQILVQAGYDSYLFCRPDKKHLDLPSDTFRWQGFDGSDIMAHRSSAHYNSQYGQAGKKINEWLNDPSNNERKTGLVLWGIGNHGGGPSEKDINDIKVIKGEENTWNIRHGTPEEYFSHVSGDVQSLPFYKGDLNPFAIGCYTSMRTVKQALFKIEHRYFTAEKLFSLASASLIIKYPAGRMDEALKEILFCQFHDILPGTSVETVEKDVLNRIGHATKIIDNELAFLLIKIANSLDQASPGEFPIMLINPHPFDVDEIIELELQLPEPNFNKSKIRIPLVYNENGELIITQSEKPLCNIKEDHRKRLVFRVIIPAGTVKRYSCYLKDVSKKEIKKTIRPELIFSSERSKIKIDQITGMPAFWEYDGKQLLGTDPIKFAVIADNADPWGMGLKSFDGQTGYFSLMTNSQASKFAGLSGRNLPPVYISENGPVRTIVESLFIYNSSRLHLRYIIPSGKPDFDIEMTVYWMEKDKLLKWIIPAGFNMKCLSRSVCGINCSKTREDEQVMRDWIGIKNLDEKKSFSICSEGAFGFDRIGNSLRISLLRAPAYSGHPVEGHPDIIWSDRAVKRMDQGVHSFRFRFIPGEKNELIDNSFNHSDLFNNPVISRIVYPSGKENFSFKSMKISDNTINLQTIKPHDEESIIIRLLNPCKVSKRFMVTVPLMSAEAEIEMSPRELKTFIISKGSSQFSESDLLERVTK